MYRVNKKVFRGALLHDLAVIHKDNPVGNFAGKSHFVSNSDHGHAFPGELLHDIKHLADHLRIEEERNLLVSMKSHDDARDSRQIVAKSEKMKHLLKVTDQIAGTDSTILITGETGTGKEIIKYDRQVYTNFSKEHGLKDLNVISIFEDSRGNLWFGTDDGGLNLFKDGKFSVFNTKEGQIKSIFAVICQVIIMK